MNIEAGYPVLLWSYHEFEQNVRSERKADARIALTGVRYFEVGRLLNPLTRFVNDLLAILFSERSFLTFRQNIQHYF